MIAALGMYDRPELRAETDRYWALIRDRLRATGIAARESLVRDDRAWMAGWLSPELLLSQTCGLPFRARLQGHVTLIGTPDFGVEGCPPGYYCSVLICRAGRPVPTLEDLQGLRFVVNEGLSQSGWAAPLAHMQARGLDLRVTLQSGGHVASARAVAEGRADWAALDAVTWRLIGQHDAALAAQLQVVGRTAPTPGLPYVTAAGRDPAPIRAAITEAIAALRPEDRAALGLRGLVQIPAEAYLALPVPALPVLQAD